MHRRMLLIALVRLAVALGGIGLLFAGLPSKAQTTASVTLAWNPSPSSGIAGYRLHYGTSSGNHPNIVNVGNTTTATVSRLTVGQTYYFVATAYNTVGLESPPSNEVSVNVTLNSRAPVWHHIDISALATAPPAAGDPSGYVLGGGEFVVYRGTDNHVHQLFAAANQGPWSHADLTALTNAPSAAGNPFGYLNAAQLVVYRGTDNDIHRLYTFNNNTQWAQADLSKLAGAPPAAGDPFPLPSGPSGRQIVDYKGTDGHIHALSINGSGNWAHTDITALTNAPLSAGDPFEYLQGGNQLVPFRGVDTDIHELYTINNTQWVQADLSKLAGAPPATGDPFGSLSPGGNQTVDYKGTDGHIHVLYISSGHWLHVDLTTLTNAPLSAGDPFEYLQGGNQLVPFRGVDTDIHQLYTINNNTQWVQADLSKLAGAPPSASDPFAYIFGNQVVVYRGTDWHIHLLFLQ